MSNVLNRTTKQHLTSVNTPDYPPEDWIVNPDLSAVIGWPTRYWKIAGDAVTLQTEEERNATDDALFLAAIGVGTEETELFGDGNDGEMTISSNTSLTRDIYPTRLTVDPGITLDAAGFRIVAKQGVIANGTISNDGSDAAGSMAGAGGKTGTIGGGGNGATGVVGAGVASDSSNSDAAPGQGGRGGNGGAGGSGSGGTSGNIRSQANSRVRSRRFDSIVTMADFDEAVSDATVRFYGGTGGGSGAGDGANAGGGGGGGGGIVVIVSPYIFIAPGGSIRAIGGRGGDADGGNAGSGGGGGGGLIATATASLRDRGLRNVSAGAAGTPSGTGAAGASGNDGRLINVKVR